MGLTMSKEALTGGEPDRTDGGRLHGRQASIRQSTIRPKAKQPMPEPNELERRFTKVLRDAPEPEKQPDKAPSHPRGRGRARFTTTPEFTQITEAQKQETTTRKRVNPVALERRTQTAPASRTYEVSEIVEESPIDSFKRQSKPRVLTESRFEARNAPKKPLFEPAPSTPEPTVDELLKSFGSNLETTIPDISITTIKQDLDSTSEDSEIASANNVLPSTEPSKQDNEIKKESSKAPETTTKTEQRRPQNRRVNVVARGRATPIQTEVSTQASRTRGRTRPTRKPEVTSASTTTASTRAALRTGRRRSETPEPIKSRGPSVLLAEETREAPSRSRTGRRINNRIEEKSPEKITIDLNAAPVTNSNSRSRFSGKPTARSETSTPSRRAGSRFPSRTATTEASRSTTSALPVTKGTTHVRKALRSRTRVTTTTLSPPVFDEQKLEVLPLFETEAKTVLPPKTKRNFSGEEMSATETDNKFTAKPNDIQSRVTVSHRVETRKQTYFKRKVTKRPLVKETVVAEVTEVTSRSTARKRNNEIPVEIKGRIKVDGPKVSVSSSISRGRKKSSARNKSDLTSSEEDIEDGDNYPKEFKALIQAKKNKKESRLPPRTNPTTGRTNDVASTVPSTVPTVTTTTQSTTTTVTTEAVKENADLENEVLPKTTAPTFRPTRKRIVKVLEKTTPRRQPSTTRQKVVRSTTFAPIESTRTSHRFHAKFNSKPESSESSLRTEKNYKSSRNRYSSRKSKETVKEEKSGKVPTEPTIKPTQISRNAAGAKKSNRFSAKYRGDTSLRGARSSTAAPAYIPTIPTAPYVPTIPTLVPPTTTIKWSKGTLDKDLGLEVLTIDDPVAYTVPSANLVNEEFVSPTNSNRLSNSVVTTTEKPVSIIERIINSITAISTTAVPDATTTPFTTPKTEPSAILKLATKKPTKQDKTQPDKTNNPSITTEKPTTIIERILSSLSAIQADDEINSNKVGNNFNTLSSPSTTPISRVTKSSRSIPSPTAQFSTINPLTILDEISDEQVLQKRTIGKLLSLLNGLTSTVKPQTIVVTPKPSNTLTTLTTTDSTLFTSTPLQDDVNINSRFNVDSTEAAVPSTVQSSTEPPSTTVPSTESITTAVTEASSVPSTEAAGSTTEAVTSTVRTTDESSTVSKEIATPNPLSLDSNDLGVLNLFVAPDVTRDLTESSTVGMEGEFTETVYTIPSTIPTLSNFEVSPNSVSIFSANDLSNAITSDDNLFSTVTISARANFGETITTDESTTESTTSNAPVSTTAASSPASSTEATTAVASTSEASTTVSSAEASTNVGSTEASTTIGTAEAGTTIGTAEGSTTVGNVEPSTTIGSVETSTTVGGAEASTTAGSAEASTTAGGTEAGTTAVGTEASTAAGGTEASTTAGGSEASTTIGSTEAAPSSTEGGSDSTTVSAISDENNTAVEMTTEGTINPLTTPVSVSNTTEPVANNTDASSSANTTDSQSNRSGRLLNVVQDPVENSLDVTTTPGPDYYVFAVLNNNTILRKKPLSFPPPPPPYVVVGVYPNNTIVRKFPNGTLIPMDMIIRVSGFDTRPNPPPLPEITSNQVTNDPGAPVDNTNVQTDNVDENTVPSVDLNSPNLSTSTSGSPTVSTSTPNTSTLDTPTSTTSAGENRAGKALDIDSTTINSPISTTEGASESVQSSTEQVVQITPEKALEIDSTTVSSQISTGGSNAAVESSTEPVVENKVEDAVTISAQISSTEGSSESAQSSTELVADKDSTTVVSQISTTEIPSATTEASTEAVVETRAGKALDINTVTSGPNESEQTSTEPAADVQSSTLTPQQLSTLSPELSTMLSILSTTLGGSSTTPSPTIPTLSELLNGRTLEAFNDLINNSKSNYQTLMVNQWNEVVNIQDLIKQNDVVYRWKPVTRPYNQDNKDGTSTVPPTTARTTLKPTESTSSVPLTTEPPKPTEPPTQPTTTEATTKPTEPPPPPSSSEVSVIGRVAEVPENTENILTTTTAEPIQTTTQTEPPVTTTLRTTTEAIRYTSTPTTTYQTFEPIVTSIRPTLAPITTLFPNFLTTLLSTLQPVTLAPPTTQETPKEVNTDQILAATTIAPSTSAPFLSTRGRVGYFDTISTDIPLTTRRRTQPPITITTNPPTTTQSPTRLPLTTRVSRTTIPTRTTIITSVPYVETTTSKRLKELTEEQKQNLKTLAELEKEQAALLNQLSILTSFANGGRKPASENGNLANRIIALAMDRDRTKTTTEGTTVSVRGGKKLEPSLDEVLKQYNLQGLESVTASPSPSSASTFGKSNEALIASLLKQQGIGPTTPSILQGIYTQTTTRPPRTTTRQPGRILQGLNWLLNALSPQPQAPRQKPRPKTTTSSPSDDELLTNLPTHITPVVTAAPKIRPNQLSQEDIKKLINQLETLQKNPRDSKALDFTQIKSLQNLINTNEGVLVTSSGESGTTRPSTRMIATTQLPAITTNLIVEEEDYVPTTTTRPRISLPPVRLNPVPGVDDENSDPYIRGNLITAAVNVTRAISSFLGSALQGAAQSFQSIISNGSRVVNGYMQGSSSRPG